MKDKYNKVSVVGAGAWGTALAISLASTKTKTILWAREEEVANSILNSRENLQYLSSIKVPENLEITHKMQDLAGSEALLIVCPAQFTRSICEKIIQESWISKDIALTLCSKGIEKETCMLQSEIIQEMMPSHKFAILSGPTFADEVAKLLPASLNIASEDIQISYKIQNTFEESNLSIHVIDDIIGAQMGGIVKNVIAIGCGIAAGLNLGNNIHAALITQGLKEAVILAKSKGGDPKTILDFCGSGDMVLTCSSKQSRNYSFGLEIGRGAKIDTIISDSKKAVEGYASCKPLYELAQKMNLPLPLCNIIYEILYEGANPSFIAKDL